MPYARTPVRAAIALGSNLAGPAGDRLRTLSSAVLALSRLAGTRLLAVSRMIETQPWTPPGFVGDPGGPYLNAACVLETDLEPGVLLGEMLRIEREHGRVRDPGNPSARWGPRTLDLDLLVFGERVIASAELVVPHPRLHERLFVLEPLAEIAPGLRVPMGGGARTVLELLESRRARERGESSVLG